MSRNQNIEVVRVGCQWTQWARIQTGFDFCQDRRKLLESEDTIANDSLEVMLSKSYTSLPKPSAMRSIGRNECPLDALSIQVSGDREVKVRGGVEHIGEFPEAT